MAGPNGTGREGDEAFESEAVSDHGRVEGPAEVEELSLSEADQPLPWLESGEYDEQDDGVDTGRIIGFVILAALALVALIGVIWFFSNQTGDSEFVADGSTIEAPEGPVKERPEDPGGRSFAGTGDVAPAVSEGQTREGRIATETVPKPSVDTATPANSAGAENAGTDKASSAASSGVPVQVGAYSNKADAERGWNALARQTDAFTGFKYRIVEGQADIGTVFRLQAMAGDRAAAKQLCDKLRADGLACQVK